MKHICRTAVFVANLALLTLGNAFTQTGSETRRAIDEVKPDAAVAAAAAAVAPVAYVYVQTHQGVDVYDAASTGRLTLVKGSPFATTGQMGGINGSHLISVGTTTLHSYPIESSGSVGKEVSEINTANYGGSQCGNTTGTGAFLDHTGKYFYVGLWGALYPDGDGDENIFCDAWQSYKVASTGELTFLGDEEYTWGYHGNAFINPIDTLSSDDNLAYGVTYDVQASRYTQFARNSAGVLEMNNSFTTVDPTPEPPGLEPNNYYPMLEAADPSAHMAVLMYEAFGDDASPQLASYTINSDGNIVSTNTWQNMPTPEIEHCCSVMSMSTSGKLLALAGGPHLHGLQIFHFNGAAPITTYSKVLLPAVIIEQIGWDDNNHMYALSYESNALYVYTVTPTSISEDAGAPYKIANAYGVHGLIVVPKS